MREQILVRIYFILHYLNMADSRVRRGDPPLRINEEEFVGFHGGSRATGSEEHSNLRAVLEQLQWMNAKLDRLETSQGGPNLRQDFHGGRGGRG